MSLRRSIAVGSSLETFLRFLLRSRIRGSTRGTLFLAKLFKSLQNVRVVTPTGNCLFLDLRITACHGLFSGSWCEQDEQNCIRNILRNGDVAFDIGAHLGVYTSMLAATVGPNGHVFAFEPNPRVLACLKRTIASMFNVTLHDYALSDM